MDQSLGLNEGQSQMQAQGQGPTIMETLSGMRS